MAVTLAETREQQPRELRRAIRAGTITGHTSGLADGFIQGNIAIVPAVHAPAFERYCRSNAQACPLLAMSQPGDPSLPALGEGIDIRHDLPRYRVFEDGRLAGEPTGVADLWRDDLVTFVIGCSFTFEHALMDAGIALRHVQQRRSVAMYRTTVATEPAGPFHGPLVVSMRAVAADEVERASEVTGRFPDMHGRPVHHGDPAAIGIPDLGLPDYGDVVEVLPGEVPVFWACGVTSQTALEAARIPFFIAHAPGSMLVTDLRHPAR